MAAPLLCTWIEQWDKLLTQGIKRANIASLKAITKEYMPKLNCQ
jgi:hypothetical protein